MATTCVFNDGVSALAQSIDWVGAATVHAILVSDSYDGVKRDGPAITDITTLDEFTGTGYVKGWGGAGRKALASRSVELVETDGPTVNKVRLKAANVTWTAIKDDNIRGVLIVIPGGASDTTSKILAYLDLGESLPTNGSDITIVWPTDGVIVYDNEV